jgi:hypothetical protein
MRSTTAPRISAGVMIANIAWNIAKISSGIWAGAWRSWPPSHRATPREAELAEVADPCVPGAEREAVSDQDPEHTDHARGQEALQ